MRSKAIFMALLAFAFGAQATPVSSSQAKSAARAWVARQDTFGAQIGSSVYDAKTLTMTNGVSYHAVRMLGGGTVITAGDTGDEPIVAFTSASDDLSNLDRRSPLWAFLNRDAVLKKDTSAFVVQAAMSAPLASKAAAASLLGVSRRKRCAAKWAALLEEDAASSNGTVVLTAAPMMGSSALASVAAASEVWQNKPFTAKSISDVRVSPLVQSQWSQSTELGGLVCYNYYTPNAWNSFSDGSPVNIVCGCVATALAQVLRYFEYPKGEVAQEEKTCYWNDEDMVMTMKGGVYDWSLMDYMPYGATEETRKEIGKLTHDAGVAVQMNYNSKGSGMSGAFAYNLRSALMNSFGYTSATYFNDNYTGLIYDKNDPEKFDEVRAQALQKSIYSNLDAGLPVLVGITGHQVVADGYGYSEDGLDYVHLNMGWAGSCDYWFLMPVISYEGGGEGVVDPKGTMYFQDATYNIFTNASPDSVVLSGRVLDDDGLPLAGAPVTVCRQGETEAVATASTSESGVWGVVVPNGTYDVTASFGSLEETLEGISVTKPVTTVVDWNGGTKHGKEVPTVMPESGDPNEIGNSWGNDITLFMLCVRNQRTGEEYSDLDRAIAGAEANDVLEVFDVSRFKRPATIDKNLTILCTNETPMVQRISCREGAAFEVTEGCELFLSNVVFLTETAMKVVGATFDYDEGIEQFRTDVVITAENGPEVHVAANARLAVAGAVVLGKVVTSDNGGVRLAGALGGTTFVTVECAAARSRGGVFGTATCDQATSEAWADRFLNAYDEECSGTVSAGGKLSWSDTVPIHPLRAVFCFTDSASSADTYYMKLHNLFAEHPEDGCVTVLRDCNLNGTASSFGKKRLVCTNGTPAVVSYPAGSNAVICVKSGANLSVSNLTFTGVAAEGTGAFLVTGGDLTLEAGTLITGFENNACEETEGGGAVSVYCDDDSNPGKLTMLSGSVISNCTSQGYGGGVCVGEHWVGGCSFDMFGGTIVDCRSLNFGGGVYVEQLSTMRLKGDAVAKGSTSEAGNGLADNINITPLDELTGEYGLTLLDEVTGEVHVYAQGKDTKGDAFAVVADACSASAASNSAFRIWCDEVREGEDELHGKYDSEHGVLIWSDEPIPQPPQPVKNPVAWVIYENGDGTMRTNEFATLDAALGSIVGDAIVEVNDINCPDHTDIWHTDSMESFCLTTNGVPYFGSSVTIKHAVTIRTMANDRNYVKAICRTADATIVVAQGASLTLSNIVIRGAYPVFSNVTETPSGVDCYVEFKTAGNTSMVKVEAGGELVMDEGSGIYDVSGAAERGSAAVCVEGGTLTMKEGSEIRNCICTFRKEPGQEAPAGAVLVEGTFNLEGGAITDCGAVLGGGVFVDVDGVINVSGAAFITNNYLLTDSELSTTNANLSVAHEAESGRNGELVLVDEFTGDIGYLEPRLYLPDQKVETNVFGKVAEGVDSAAMRSSAARFYRDAVPEITGLVATNATKGALLVWSSAVHDGVYTDSEGNEYVVVTDPEPPVPPPEPEVKTNFPTAIAFQSIERLSETQWRLVVTNRVPWCRYCLIRTDDLTKGFTETNEWEQADGAATPAWTNDVETTGGQYFWRALGTWGIVPEE